MQDWTSGYIVDVEYTQGYYAELNPLAVNFTLIANDIEAPRIKNACELGFGQGLSINIHASSSEISWYGTDFNPTHANFAKGMSSLTGAKIFDEAFSDFCLRSDLPNFDFIALHGIWSWINEDNRRIILDFISKKLNVGGVVYLSYNAMPGWASAAPLKHLFSEHHDFMTTKGSGPFNRIDASLDFIDRLIAVDPMWSRQSPSMLETLKKLKSQPRDYLAHEYLNENWRPWYFSEIATQMNLAKLSFAASSKATSYLDAMNMSHDQKAFLDTIHDHNHRQSIKDFIVNRHFRRDYWIKGGRHLNPTEKRDALRSMSVILVHAPNEVPRTFETQQGTAHLAPEVYDPILEFMSNHQPISIDFLEKEMNKRGISFQRVLDALLLLYGYGYISPAYEEETYSKLKTKTQQLNLNLMMQAKGGDQSPFLVSPITGGGIPAWRFEKLIAFAILEGKETVSDIAQYVWNMISPYGQKLVKNGKVLERQEDNLSELKFLAEAFMKDRFKILKGLQII